MRHFDSHREAQNSLEHNAADMRIHADMIEESVEAGKGLPQDAAVALWFDAQMVLMALEDLGHIPEVHESTLPKSTPRDDGGCPK